MTNKNRQGFIPYNVQLNEERTTKVVIIPSEKKHPGVTQTFIKNCLDDYNWTPEIMHFILATGELVPSFQNIPVHNRTTSDDLIPYILEEGFITMIYYGTVENKILEIYFPEREKISIDQLYSFRQLLTKMSNVNLVLAYYYTEKEIQYDDVASLDLFISATGKKPKKLVHIPHRNESQ